MKYVIDEAIAEKSGLSFPQMLMLMFINTGSDIKWVISELLDKEAIINIGTPPNRYELTKKWSILYDTVIAKSLTSIPTEEELIPLAEKLMAMFPQGKKPGTPYTWRANKREIALRLRSFFKKYNTLYDEEEILDATRRYVDSFNGDYRFMRILKYFIWKKEDGEEISELASFIENSAQEDSDIGDNWVNQLK